MSCCLKIEKDFQEEDLKQITDYLDLLVVKVQNSTSCGRLTAEERKSLYEVQNFVNLIIAAIREELSKDES